MLRNGCCVLGRGRSEVLAEAGTVERSREMRSLKFAGLCLASMLVVGTASVGNASAATLLWLVCLKSSGLTKYENSKCLKASGAGNNTEGWQSLGVPAGVSTTVKLLWATLVLRDNKTTLGELEVQCYAPGMVGKGLIESGGKGEVLAFEAIEPEKHCKGIKVCEEVTHIQGRGLPWAISLFEGPEGKPLTKIEPGRGGGRPGWEIKCHSLIGEITDACEEESQGKQEEIEFKSEITSSPFGGNELLVRGRFQEVGQLICSVQGSTEHGKGKISGLFAALLPGGALSINKS
jgi:hypothetical protein